MALDIKHKLSDSSCRICLGHFEITNSIFDFVEYEEGEQYKVEMRDMLTKLSSKLVINVDETAKPTRLCQECTDKLINSYEFVCNVEKNEEILNNYLKSVQEKEVVEKEEEVSTQDYESIGERAVEPYSCDEEEMEFLEDEYNALNNFPTIKEQYSDENEMKLVCIESAEMWTALPDGNVEDEVEVVLEEEEEEQENTEENQISIKQLKKETSKDPTKEQAGKRYSIGSRLGIYETSHWHKCEHCDRPFAKLTTLERHVRYAHTPVSAEDFAAIAPKPTVEQPLQCDHCLRTFVRKDALHRHVQAMHPTQVNEDDKSPQQSGTKNKTSNRRMCPYCGEYFSQAGLIVHIRRHTGETPYTCEECGKGFPRRQDLVLHMRQHSGERPHICTACGKSFKNPNKLARHSRIHTGVRPYKCTNCGKGFTQSNDLKIHMRRHTGEKPYKCDVCGEGFICGAALKTHRRNKLHHEPLLVEMVDPYEKVRVRNRAKKLNAMGETEDNLEDNLVMPIKTEEVCLAEMIGLIET